MTTSPGYDIVGDIHGQFAQLSTLLERLGYVRESEWLWTPPRGRSLIFLGDLIDRGPDSLSCVMTAKHMCDTGRAQCLMGNHEFNAACWAIEAKDRPSGYLRSHTAAHRRVHGAFLNQAGENSPLHKDLVEWFKKRPLRLETKSFRCVHACWDPQEMDILSKYVGIDGVASDDAIFREASRDNASIYRLLYGTDIQMPWGVTFRDPDGVLHRNCRIRWWIEAARPTWKELLISRFSGLERFPDSVVPSALFRTSPPQKITFIGHYWLEPKSPKTPLTPMVACLDYSAGSGGPVVAYRWNEGDTTLSEERYEAVFPDSL